MSCRQDRAHNLPVLLTLSPLQRYGPAPSTVLLLRLLTIGPKKIKDLSYLRSLVRLEKDLTLIKEDDLKDLLIPLSYKSHTYTMKL
jgi:hypothetical protein